MWLSFSIRYFITRCCLSVSTVYVPKPSCTLTLTSQRFEVKDPRCKTGTWGTQIHFNGRCLGRPEHATSGAIVLGHCFTD
jgi:hypothetical protein